MISGGDISALKNARCGTQSTLVKQTSCNSAYDAALALATHGVAADQRAEAEAMFTDIESALYNECVTGNASMTNPLRSAAACTFLNFNSTYMFEGVRRTFSVSRWASDGEKDFTFFLGKIVPALAASAITDDNIIDKVKEKLQNEKAKNNLNKLVEIANSVEDNDTSGNILALLKEGLKELIKKHGNRPEVLTHALQYPKETQFRDGSSYQVTIVDPVEGQNKTFNSLAEVQATMEERSGNFSFKDKEAEEERAGFANTCEEDVVGKKGDAHCEAVVGSAMAKIIKLAGGREKAEGFFKDSSASFPKAIPIYGPSVAATSVAEVREIIRRREGMAGRNVVVGADLVYQPWPTGPGRDPQNVSAGGYTFEDRRDVDGPLNVRVHAGKAASVSADTSNELGVQAGYARGKASLPEDVSGQTTGGHLLLGGYIRRDWYRMFGTSRLSANLRLSLDIHRFNERALSGGFPGPEALWMLGFSPSGGFDYHITDQLSIESQLEFVLAMGRKDATIDEGNPRTFWPTIANQSGNELVPNILLGARYALE